MPSCGRAAPAWVGAAVMPSNGELMAVPRAICDMPCNGCDTSSPSQPHLACHWKLQRTGVVAQPAGNRTAPATSNNSPQSYRLITYLVVRLSQFSEHACPICQLNWHVIRARLVVRYSASVGLEWECSK